MAPSGGIQLNRLVTNGRRFALQHIMFPPLPTGRGGQGVRYTRSGPFDALGPAVDRRSGSRPKQLFEDTCVAPDRRAGEEAI